MPYICDALYLMEGKFVLRAVVYVVAQLWNYFCVGL